MHYLFCWFCFSLSRLTHGSWSSSLVSLRLCFCTRSLALVHVPYIHTFWHVALVWFQLLFTSRFLANAFLSFETKKLRLFLSFSLVVRLVRPFRCVVVVARRRQFPLSCALLFPSRLSSSFSCFFSLVLSHLRLALCWATKSISDSDNEPNLMGPPFSFPWRERGEKKHHPKCDFYSRIGLPRRLV